MINANVKLDAGLGNRKHKQTRSTRLMRSAPHGETVCTIPKENDTTI